MSAIASETHREGRKGSSDGEHDTGKLYAPESPHETDQVVIENREELGTGIAQASAKVWGKYSRWILYISLGLAAYVYSLDLQTTYFYTQFATSSFSTHSLLASIEVAAQIILAVAKPIIARISDLQSRPFAYFVVVISYVLGYILIASSKGVSQFAAGRVFQSLGSAGLQLLTQVIVADYTSLKYRGLVSALMNLPFIINAFVGSKVAASITDRNALNGWRWGYAMFSILIPVSLSPVIATLVWGERKAKRLGIVSEVQNKALVSDEVQTTRFQGITRKILGFAVDMDLLGLLLLGTGWALFLLALTLNRSAKGGWDNPSIIAMLVVGPVIVILFAIYEVKWAKFPVIPGHFLRNRAVFAAALIGFFDFVSFYLTFLYLSSFLYVLKTGSWSQTDQNYFGSIQTVGLTLFGIVSAGLMAWTRRYKWILVIGLCIRVLGVGIMIRSRGANGSDGELVMTQILQAWGGGFASITSMVGAQASVTHKYVAMVTAIVLLITELGGAIGSAIAGAIWTNLMPRNLAKYLPNVSEEERNRLYGSTISIAMLDPSDPVRIGAIAAYSDTMKILIIVALVIGILPIFIALTMPNYYLSDAQNAIDGLDITGKKVAEPQDPVAGAEAASSAEKGATGQSLFSKINVFGGRATVPKNTV
ncbi:hypothetical protein FRC14_007194 [Serendipita sp. 396]|nr:hypothetical protein FRC14_007194 [Serendipita sp. 396]